VRAAEVAEGVSRLVNKSLVQAEERDGAMRYRFLEIMRQYAATKLEAAAGAEAVRRNHLDYFVRLAEDAEPKLTSLEQRTWAMRLEAEHDNLRAAWAWGLEHNPAAVIRMAWGLRLFWYRQGYLNEAQEWCTQLLTRVEPAQAASALSLAGTVANWQYNHSTARAYFEQSLTLARAGEDQLLVAGALHGIGVATMGLGELAAARTHLEQGLELFREMGNEWRVANVLGGLCVVLADQGDYAQARQLGAESLALYQKLGDRAGTAQPLLNLGELARAQADYVAAAAYYDQCLTLDTKGNQGAAMLNLGQVAVRQGQMRRARELLGASLAFYRDQNNAAAVATCLTGLAGILVTAGRPEPAAQLFGAVDEQWKLSGTAIHAADRDDYDYHLAQVRANMDETRFRQAQARGRQLKLEQAIELAVSEVAAAEAAAPETALAAPPARPELTIQGLGPARVWRGGRELVSADWRYAKAKELLFFLLCQPPQTKEQIGLALWPDASPAQLRNNLGVTLHYLRRALGRGEWIAFEQERYTFNRSLSYWFDLEAFETGLAEARRRAGDGARARWQDALKLYQGDLAADLTDSDWPSARREALRRDYLEALLKLGGLGLAAGRYAEAAETYRTAIAADSYQEQAHRELMRCLARMGERGQAMRQYQGLTAHLREQLGAPPAAETTALYEQLRHGEAI
jgi:DNA-binding SARP family transcriptional activator